MYGVCVEYYYGVSFMRMLHAKVQMCQDAKVASNEIGLWCPNEVGLWSHVFGVKGKVPLVVRASISVFHLRYLNLYPNKFL